VGESAMVSVIRHLCCRIPGYQPRRGAGKPARLARSRCTAWRLLIVLVWSGTLAVSAGALHAGSSDHPSRTPDRTFEISPDPQFADSVEPGALQLVCFERRDALAAFFAGRGLPFEPTLVRRMKRLHCHIYYEPSQPGFRADPDDLPVSELYADVDALRFLAGETTPFGDNLEIVEDVAAMLPERVTLHVGVETGHDQEAYHAATRARFPEARNRIRLRDSGARWGNPWVQDYLKSGRQAGARRILVTRDLYQGRQDDAVVFRPLLEKFDGPEFVRSRLAWEGGDLQFVRDPRDPARQILFHGDAAKRYWGTNLTPAEYAYVLKVEFGADLAVDLSELAAHVDYVVSFLPADHIVLVSLPRTGDFELAREAAAILANHFGATAPPEIVALKLLLDDPDMVSRRRLEEAVHKARERQGEWHPPMDVALAERLRDWLVQNCQESDCFEDGDLTLDVQNRFLRTDPALLRDWTSVAMTLRSSQALISASLAIIESQIHDPSQDLLRRMNRKVKEVEALGFRTIRLPWIIRDSAKWAGVSYTNNLLVDEILFVPTFGLGRWERQLVADLQEKLPAHYRVVPIYAQHMILHNGGIHCAFAIVRHPEPPGPTL
jgi:hypothetical protein